MIDPTQHSILEAINELAAVAKWPDVKSADVPALAMERAGVLTESRWLVLHTEVDPPADAVIAHSHDALVALVREPDPARRLVRGQGDFGSAEDSEPAANPLFTYCRLTESRPGIDCPLTAPLARIQVTNPVVDRGSWVEDFRLHSRLAERDTVCREHECHIGFLRRAFACRRRGIHPRRTDSTPWSSR